MATKLLVKVRTVCIRRNVVIYVQNIDGFKENATVYIDKIVAPLNSLMIPFSSIQGVSLDNSVFTNTQLNDVFQNHDNEANISHIEEIRREWAQAPHFSYTRTAPPGIGGPSGPGTYWVPVRTFTYNSCIFKH